MGAYVSQEYQGWPQPEPAWENETEYQETHSDVLDGLSKVACKLAKEDTDAFDWLMHQIAGTMADAYQICKDRHDKD